MAVGILRLGLIIMGLGLLLYLMVHIIILTALVCGLGFVLVIVGVVLWSLENPGDISLS